MNCFSACKTVVGHCFFLTIIIALGGCGVPASESAESGETGEYAVHYTIRPLPDSSAVGVALRLRQPAALLRELSFPADAITGNARGDGRVQRVDGRVTWLPPRHGGVLEWTVSMSRERDGGGFDAYMTPNWGVFRMEDAIPRARTRTLRGAVSLTSFDIELPAGWSFVSEYAAKERPIVLDRPERRFDQPTGWVAVGDLGVRRETIAGTRVVIAAPVGHDVRRLEMLALLNWTLPELNEILPDAVPRLTVVSAGEPMWRGGLSAPASLFLHADRPLISENGTSPLLHELLHVGLGVRPRAGFDWIAEGLAEYYGIELLRRGRAITAKRAAAALDRQAAWARRAERLCASESRAATTALAVTVFDALDSELAEMSNDEVSLDDLLPLLAGTRTDLASLTAAANTLVGATPDTLHIDNLPGCRSIAAANPHN